MVVPAGHDPTFSCNAREARAEPNATAQARASEVPPAVHVAAMARLSLYLSLSMRAERRAFSPPHTAPQREDAHTRVHVLPSPTTGAQFTVMRPHTARQRRVEGAPAGRPPRSAAKAPAALGGARRVPPKRPRA